MIGVLAQSGVQDAVTGSAGIPVAFAIGMVSFFSPCVLPLVPGYLSYVSGVSAQDLAAGESRGRVVGATALFVLGFAVVFTALGATASALGAALTDNLSTLQRIGGSVVIVMGLGFLSTLAIKPMQRLAAGNGARHVVGRVGLRFAGVFAAERGGPRARAGVGGALPLGAAFAVSWTPCVGPGLGAILTMAGTQGQVGRGAILLLAFSLGFGVWFVLGGLAFRRASRAFDVVRRHLRTMVLAGGAFMVAIGIFMVLDYWDDVLAPLRTWINHWAPPI
jgi:cytochrome c-type biogenesis protein